MENNFFYFILSITGIWYYCRQEWSNSLWSNNRCFCYQCFSFKTLQVGLRGALSVQPTILEIPDMHHLMEKKNSENILLEKYWDKPVGWSLSYVYGNLEMLFHLPPNISKFWIKKLPKIPFIIPPPLPKKTSNNKPLTLS